MADYWKSQPRKFCQYCKCWIADNKPSIEFHERGKNHKENVAAKITEIKKKSVEKMKQEQRQCKQFAAMEEAAMKAYEEDLKRMGMESGSGPQAQTTVQPQPQIQPQIQPQAQPRQAAPQTKKIQVKKWKPKKSPKKETKSPVWVEGKTEDGHTYYYNTITGDSQWVNPESVQEETTEPAPPGSSSSGSTWMEAISPEGHTYYYNTETGDSTWEKPADYPSQEESRSSSGSSREGETQSEPLTPQPEPLSGGEESSNGAPASQEAEVSEQSSQQPKVPKISFRKRKAEDGPSEQQGEDKASVDKPKDDAEQGKKEEEVQSTITEPKEEKKTQAKKPKTINPYGTWEQIQQEEDPYASVDLQLPVVEGSTATAPAELPPEPKPKFKERVITSLGEEGGPASFKKNRTQNSKSRSLRQRDNDD